MAAINQQMGWREWRMLMALALLWGGSFFFVEIAIRALSPVVVVFMRVTLAAIALWGFVLLKGIAMPRDRASWAAFGVMALLNNVIPFCLIAWGQQYVGSALASILNATTPLMTVLIAGACLTDERLSWARVAGVLVGLSGVALIVGVQSVVNLSLYRLAASAIVVAAVSYACAGVYGRRFKVMAVSPVAVATGQVTVSSGVLAVTLLVCGVALPGADVGLSVWFALIGLGLLSTAVAYLLYFGLLERVGATNLLLVTLLIPMVAATLGIVLLGESLQPADMAGMALIGAGLLIIDGRAGAAVAARGRRQR